MQDLPKRDCIVCYKPFKPIRINNIICSEPRCKWIRHRRQITQWARKHYVHIKKDYFECPYCYRGVPRTRLNQKTCGGLGCIERHNYQMKLRRKRGIYDRRYMG